MNFTIQPQLKSPLPFPTPWLWLVDEAIPQLVKKKYSPRDSWKSKPFSKEDSRFFFKGIEDLSRLFTEERPKGMPPYFQHERYRSSYLLYFLPLQAAKFITLFQLHPAAIQILLKKPEGEKPIRIADLGAGPGTASLSLILALHDLCVQQQVDLPPLEFHWFDTNKTIMEDGRDLVETLCQGFPKLRSKVKVHLHPDPWWKASTVVTDSFSFVMVGHVLNESFFTHSDQGKIKSEAFWEKLLKKTDGAGVLFAEPAFRKSAQNLSQLRDLIFGNNWVPSSPTRLWGPCLHAGSCPLAQGRDWCHFSIPIQIPGKWFKNFSEALSTERLWVKFSYLWIASEQHPAPAPPPHLKRVISDPLPMGPKSSVLICEPEIAGRESILPRQKLHRGDLIQIRK